MIQRELKMRLSSSAEWLVVLIGVRNQFFTIEYFAGLFAMRPA